MVGIASFKGNNKYCIFHRRMTKIIMQVNQNAMLINTISTVCGSYTVPSESATRVALKSVEENGSTAHKLGC